MSKKTYEIFIQMPRPTQQRDDSKTRVVVTVKLEADSTRQAMALAVEEFVAFADLDKLAFFGFNLSVKEIVGED